MVEEDDAPPERPELVDDTQTRFLLTGAALDTLKLTAMILMVIDHINVALFDGAYFCMQALGRGAFPLFA